MSSENSQDKIPGTPRKRYVYPKMHDGKEPFFPNFLLKEWIVGAMFLTAFMIWVINNHVVLGSIANPSDSNYIPMPDWYFYFLYQFLKYFSGPNLVWGTFWIPIISMVILFGIPWLDRGKTRKIQHRPLAAISMVLFVFMCIWLTAEAYQQHQYEVGGSAAASTSATSTGGSGGLPFAVSHPKNTTILNTSMPGYTIFQNNCAGCHGSDLKGVIGPELLGIGNKASATQLQTVITKGFSPNMPPSGGLSSTQQVKQVAQWLATQTQQ